MATPNRSGPAAPVHRPQEGIAKRPHERFSAEYLDEALQSIASALDTMTRFAAECGEDSPDSRWHIMMYASQRAQVMLELLVSDKPLQSVEHELFGEAAHV